MSRIFATILIILLFLLTAAHSSWADEQYAQNMPIDTRPAWLNNMASPPVYLPQSDAVNVPAAPVVAASPEPAAQKQPAEYVPATVPNLIEAGVNYYDVSNNYGNTFGQFVNVQYQTDPWNRWTAGVQHAEAFHDSGAAFSIGDIHTFDEDWFGSFGVGTASSASFLVRYRADASLSYKWPDARNFITTVGYTWDEADKTYTDNTLHLGAAYYFADPWVVQAVVSLNDSNPGSVIAPSATAAVTYGYQKHYFLTGSVGIAREAYQILSTGNSIQNSFTSYTIGANWRQWVGDDWGFNIGTEYYTNRYYDHIGGTVSVFKEFDGPFINDTIDWPSLGLGWSFADNKTDNKTDNKDTTPATEDLPGARNGFFFHPYIGADYQYIHGFYNNVPEQSFNYSDIIQDNLNGGDVHIGVRLHKYFGLEGSYFDTAHQGKSNALGTGINTSFRVSGETLDAMGYLPLEESDVELIALLGVARTMGDASFNFDGDVIPDKGTEYDPRFGGGVQYWLSDKFNLRGLITYQEAHSIGINGYVITSVGVNYQY